MLFYFIFFIIVVPICILLHEIGHGIGAVITAKSTVHIYLGVANEHNKENFKIGRFHFHIRWAYVGFAYWEEDLNKRQSLVALAGGPIMSLLLAILFGYFSFLDYGDIFRQLFGWTAIYNALQFIVTIIPLKYPRWMGAYFRGIIVTIIPLKYPRWMGAYKGLPSDGLQLIQLLKQ